MAGQGILLLGASGQVALKLQRTLSPFGPLHVAGREAGSIRADLTDPDSIRDAVRTVRPGHDQRYAIDAGKIERELGWMPVESFESGLDKTVRWHLANGDWCRIP